MKASSILVAVLLAATPGLAHAQSAQPDAMHGMAMKGAATNPATKSYMQSMQGMQDAMAGMTPSNDPDKDFVAMMKPHHQAAVEMAETYLKYGSDPMLKAMAKDIVSSQNKEIAQMNAWQAKHAR